MQTTIVLLYSYSYYTYNVHVSINTINTKLKEEAIKFFLKNTAGNVYLISKPVLFNS